VLRVLVVQSLKENMIAIRMDRLAGAGSMTIAP